MSIRINRNIMECKDQAYFDNIHVHNRINRNIMECKETVFCLVELTRKVLIETLWNVKRDLLGIQSLPQRSINRNIMECKGNQSTHYGQ